MVSNKSFSQWEGVKCGSVPVFSFQSKKWLLLHPKLTS